MNNDITPRKKKVSSSL